MKRIDSCLLVIVAMTVCTPAVVSADPDQPNKDCTVAECAKRMLDMAVKLMAENKELRSDLFKIMEKQKQLDVKVKTVEDNATKMSKSIDNLSATIAGGHGQVLAAGIVKGRQLVSASTGLGFDSGTGKVTFPNPKGMKYVPLMGPISPNDNYLTESCFTRQLGGDYFILWQGAQDTTGRNGPPQNCTFVVVGAD